MCRVSVLVPIYNVETYLEQCLLSLSAQDMKEMEFICLNDGSTDKSSEIAHRFKQQDARFHVIDKENSGYGKTMNLGLSLARGEYIGIVESDDFVEPDMFSSLYRTAKENQADVVKSSFWVHINGLDEFNDAITGEWYDKVISNHDAFEIFEGNPSIWSNIYKRSFLTCHNILFSETPGASFQDIAWRTKVFSSAQRIIFLKKAYYHYRRDNEKSSVREDGKLFCVCDEYDEAERFLSARRDWEDKYRYLIPSFRWGHYCWNCFDRWLSMKNRWIFYKRMKGEMIEYEKNGALNCDFWSPEKWKNLQKLLSNSRKYFFDQCVNIWLSSIVLNGFIDVVKSAPKLAIFGAGQVGREAVDGLHIHGIRPDCIVVSDMSGNSTDVAGIRVRTVDEILSEQSDYVVLIAVGIKSQPEVLELLLEKGFNNVVAFLPEVRHALLRERW